jgi:hypothetical protein
MAKSSIQSIGEILVLIGAIVSLIFGIIMLIPGIGWSVIPIFWGWGLEIIFGIIVIIVSLITLATSGFINLPWKLEKNWIMLLILGIILLIFGGDIGAILVIIGAILLIFK